MISFEEKIRMYAYIITAVFLIVEIGLLAIAVPKLIKEFKEIDSKFKTMTHRQRIIGRLLLLAFAALLIVLLTITIVSTLQIPPSVLSDFEQEIAVLRQIPSFAG